MAEDNLRPNSGFCNWCGNPIGGQKLIGTKKKYCSVDCRYKCTLAISNFNRFSWPKCKNEGCENRVRSKHSHHCNPCYKVIIEKRSGICTVHKCSSPAVRIGHGLCEKHYWRVNHNKSFDLRPRVQLQTEHGYRMIKDENHPLAQKSNGWAFEHRIVAYEKYGEGIQKCHWCSIELEWNQVVVDHLNEQKLDNRPENLVTACTPCNRIRGAMVSFIRKLSDEKLSHLIETFGFMRQSSFTCDAA